MVINLEEEKPTTQSTVVTTLVDIEKGVKRGSQDSAYAMDIDKPHKKPKKDKVVSSRRHVGEGGMVKMRQVVAEVELEESDESEEVDSTSRKEDDPKKTLVTIH